MTDIRESGLTRESLYAADGGERLSGLVREVLRSTGSSGVTFAAFSGLVREALISGPAVVPPGGATQARAWIMA